METQMEPQCRIPKQLQFLKAFKVQSFSEALQRIDSNEEVHEGLKLNGPFKLTKNERNSLKLLPRSFASNETIKKLIFSALDIDDTLVAEAIKSGVRKDKVKYIEFKNFKKASNTGLMETLCQGILERSAPFQLVLWKCSSEFIKPVLEASYKCFSLEIDDVDCSTLQRPLNNLFFSGNLYYISLRSVRLKERNYIELARCVALLPMLTKLNLSQSRVPVSAMKRLHGSLNAILGPSRSNLFETLILGDTDIDEKLCFSYFRLLQTDFIGCLHLKINEDVSKAVAKSISSSLANTMNLKRIFTWNPFSTETQFKHFWLQKKKKFFMAPFQVNPT